MKNNMEEFLDSDTETLGSDDSPSFDIIQHTLSKLSIATNKSKSRIPDETAAVPELNPNDQKSFEIVQHIIQAGQMEKLKVEQCKLYLRKHGLRLTGKKDVLIHRINEHVGIMNGEGEHKYPASSFVMNCKGDACTGDIVMFEQNVYEMFNVASRSATGPPCGTRVVAGRIVKESYGAAKQQHTFTIEVLWSKGEKPLPPLHPLLIKGRNLYRLKTMRQRWEDESQRRKILSEKHSRGDAARLNREARLQEKEKKKTLREIRVSKGNIQIEKDYHTMINSENPRKPDLQNISIQHGGAPYKGVLGNHSLKSMSHNNHGGTHKENIIPNDLRGPVRQEPHSPLRNSFQVEQKMVRNGFRSPVRGEPRSPFRNPVRGSFHVEQVIIPNDFRNPVRGSLQVEQNILSKDFRGPVRGEPHSPFRKSLPVEQNMCFYPSRANIYLTQNPRESHNFHQGNNHHHVPRGCYQGQRQQVCRYYSQGRCHYGTNCKYLH